MKTATSSVGEWAGHLKFQMLSGATYPLFLLAAVLRRRFAHETADEGPPRGQSTFAEARESTMIAISYALQARSALQRFAQDNRAERLS